MIDHLHRLHDPLQWIAAFTATVCLSLLWGVADLATAAGKTSDQEIHTVLPFDAIPAISDPEFVSAEEADVHSNSPMIGVSINGEQHAYSMIMLNGHEIVNDVVGGKPIATTW
jgi:hypothetical protein